MCRWCRHKAELQVAQDDLVSRYPIPETGAEKKSMWQSWVE